MAARHHQTPRHREASFSSRMVHKREKALLVPTVVTGNVSPCSRSFDGYVVEEAVTVLTYTGPENLI